LRIIDFVLKNSLSSSERKALTENTFALFVLQGADYAFTFLTLAYLVRFLGPEYYGLLAFSTATVTYFTFVTNYGFNISATRQISINRNNFCLVSELYSSVMTIKILLLIISFITLLITITVFEKFKAHSSLYIFTFGVVVGHALFPVWLFQGLERMKYPALINFLSKFVSTICIFVFVQSDQDYLYVPIITSSASIVGACFALYVVRYLFGIKVSRQPIKNLQFQILDGWYVFLSSISASFYTISATFILGIFSNNTNVGYFSAAEKIIQAAKAVFQPISQALYPLVGKKLNENHVEGTRIIQKTTILIGTIMLSISISIFFLSEPIIYTVYGISYKNSILLLQIMSIIPLFSFLSNMLGVHYLINKGYQQIFSKILFFGALISLLISLIFVPYYKEFGTALTMIFVEIFVFIYLLSIILKMKPKIISD
jgi:PST family polysaccharide transporter